MTPSASASPVPPLVCQFVPGDPTSSGECIHVDTGLSQDIVDVLAELFAYGRFDAPVLSIDGVQSRYDSFNRCKGLLIGQPAQPPRIGLVLVQSDVDSIDERLGRGAGRRPVLR